MPDSRRSRKPFPHALVACFLALTTLVVAQPSSGGNGRDARLSGSNAGIPLVGSRLLTPGASLDLLVSTPLGSLQGLPFILAADAQAGRGVPTLALPGEPDALRVSAGLVPIVNGFVPGNPGAALPASGFLLPGSVPSVPAGTRLVFQAAVLDATAPNGLAITPAGLGDLPLAPTITPRFAPAPSVLGQYGYAVLVSDLDRNGTPEIIVGAQEQDTAIADAGRVFIYSGTAPAIVKTIDDPSPQTLSHFGVSVAAGDVNGDGALDLVVGARTWDFPGQLGSDHGKAVVFYGPGYTQSTTILPPLPEDRGQFGSWMACGDFDGDGYCDLAVSSIGGDAFGIDKAGRVDVFFGPGLGPSLPLFPFNPAAGDRFGYRLESADLDDDGFDDLVIAATFKSLQPGGQDDSGAVYVYRGPFLTNTAYFPNPLPSIDGLLGADLALGDLNDDGWLDIAAGAELDDPNGQIDRGSVWLLFGPNYTTSQRVLSPLGLQGTGFGSAVAIGDVNEDGFPDLGVGEFNFDTPATNGGRAVIVYGPDWLQATNVLEPTTGSEYQFGRRLRMGDLNGDGDAELVIGVPFSSAVGVSRAGAIYIVD